MSVESNGALRIVLSDEQLEGLAERVALKLRQSPAAEDLIDQRSSPLGKRRHGDAVRRRIELGLPGACRVGRRWLLTPAALTEELARISRPPKPSEPDPAERLRAELGGDL